MSGRAGVALEGSVLHESPAWAEQDTRPPSPCPGAWQSLKGMGSAL